eukprot:1154559-Pelagomonas_calceolata.AAC.2
MTWFSTFSPSNKEWHHLLPHERKELRPLAFQIGRDFLTCLRVARPALDRKIKHHCRSAYLNSSKARTIHAP